MLLYRLTAEMSDINLAEDPDKYNELVRNSLELTEEYNRGYPYERDIYLFLSALRSKQLVIGAAVKKGRTLPMNEVEAYLCYLGIECAVTKTRETNQKEFHDLLENAEKNELIDDADYAAMKLNIDLWERRDAPRECMLDINVSKEELIQRANDLLCAQTLVPELERIYEKPADKDPIGHPVHYLIQIDDERMLRGVINILLSALYLNGRISSRRFLFDAAKKIAKHKLGNYDYSRNGTLITRFEKEQTESEYADDDVCLIGMFARLAYLHRDKVLTVFCLPKTSNRLKRVLMENLKDITLVELSEDAVSHEQARGYLKRRAEKESVPVDDSLYRELDKSITFFHPAELNEMYSRWFSQRVKKYFYPQYAHLDTAGSIYAKEKPMGDAYEELRDLIGLEQAKVVIDQVLDYSKAQALFKERGMNQSRTALHMIFTGNPGSAKTTVARLVARIMRENKLLSVGSLIEVGRSDLVGKYVGWTAKLVKEAFERAKGSVLFIDEAYSLVDDKEGLYGDEAINTIVQEMENNREDMVVIFAGYPDKMEQFLLRNPGLRSRIAFHIPFDDYTPSELYQILGLLASKQQLSLAAGVEDKLLPIFEAASLTGDFGNGRFVRNLLEQARMRQASRLVHMGPEQVSVKDVNTLIPEDFEYRQCKTNDVKRKIGFSI